MMKNYFYLIVLLSSFSACEVLEETTVKSEIASTEFEKLRLKDDLEIIDLSSFENFAELRDAMGKLSCQDINSGLTFEFEEKEYYLTGIAACPDPGVVSCHFQTIQIFIKNDSIVRESFRNKKEPIEDLGKELHNLISKPYLFRIKEDIMKRALIHLYIEEKEDIIVTKKVLAEITQQFAKLNSGARSDFFEYDILFTRLDPTNIPPPPPPLPETD
jgi:hypothetical protein